ncbi:Pol polyprotein, partial [Smittium mucronatum]
MDIKNFIINSATPPNSSEKFIKEIRNAAKSYELVKGELFKKSRKNGLRKVLHQRNAKEEVFRIHNEFHHGINNTWDKVKRNYFGYKLYEVVKEVCRECKICQKHNRGIHNVSHLNSIVALRPFEIMGLDAIGPINPVSNSKNRYILTAVDYFTKWPIAKAVENIQTSTVINFIVTEVVQEFGVPHQLITDRGSNFLSDVSVKLYEFLQIKHTPTTTYRPQANGQVERLNRTLKNAISKLCEGNTKDWDCFLWKALLSIRSMRNNSTGISPSKMLYGIEMKLPTEWETEVGSTNFEDEIMKRIEFINIDLPEIRKEGLNKNLISKNSSEIRYNKNVKVFKYKLGDKVLR